MRSALLSLLFFSAIFGQGLSAQGSFYFSDSSAQWNLLTTEYAQNTYYSTFIFQTAGSQLIGNYYYEQINNGANENFVRRDTTGKVFYRAATDSLDYLIYDFGKVTGDTFSFFNPWISTGIIYVTVVGTDTVNWGGIRKLMSLCLHFGSFDTVCYGAPIVCVDGIGALNSDFLRPGIDKAILDGPTFNLLCYFADSNTVYHNSNYQSCTVDTTILGINETSLNNTLHISPNPVTGDFVNIQLGEGPPPSTSLQLFDLTGRMVLQQPVTEKLSHVPLNNLASGMYLYSINSPDQKLNSGKLVIQ